MVEILMGFLSIFKWFFVMLDTITFGLIDNVYNLITIFASGEMFDSTAIEELMRNTYVIIGIFAFFKLAMAFVNAMINPDKLFDSEKGVGSVAKNFIIMFVLLIAVPLAFDLLMEAQKIIVNGNYINKIFLNNDTKAKDPGKMMEKTAVESLIYINDDVYEWEKVKDENGKLKWVKTDELKDKCKSNCQEAIKEYNGKIKNSDGVSWGTIMANVGVSIEAKLERNGEDAKEEEIYVYNYTILVTTIVGGFITYVLAGFAFDIAVRTVELAVLEVIAPLFIVTYIDPKSAKSGPFHNWLTTVGKTYASLFIKLAILALMFALLGLLDNFGFDGIPGGAMAKLFMLLAILAFAKKAPGWISSLIGIKESEAGLGGLGKKLAALPLVGAGLTKAGHALAGAGMGAVRNAHAYRKAYKAENLKNTRGLKNVTSGYLDSYRNSKDAGNKGFKAFGSGVAGAARGVKKGYFSKGAPTQNLKNIGKTAAAGGIGFLSGAASGVKLGWAGNDLKDVNAKVKADAKASFDKYAPGYKSLGSRAVAGATDKYNEKWVNPLMGDSYAIDKRRRDAEKNKKSIDRHGKIEFNPDGSRNKLLSPVNLEEINSLVKNINDDKNNGLKLSASSSEDISKAYVQARIDAGLIDGKRVEVTNEGISIDGATSIKAKDYCKQENIYTPYGEKEIELAAKENAYTKASEYVSNQTRISEANVASANANQQLVSIQANVKATLGDDAFDTLRNLDQSIVQRTKFETKLDELRAKTVPEDPAEKDKYEAEVENIELQLNEINGTIDTVKKSVDGYMGVGSGESYEAATKVREESNKVAQKLEEYNIKISDEVKHYMSQAENNFKAKDYTTGDEYQFLEDPTKNEYVVTLLAGARDKAKEDASKYKPKEEK